MQGSCILERYARTEASASPLESSELTTEPVTVTQEHARAEIDCLLHNEPLFALLLKHFKHDEQCIDALLRAVRINKHDFAHQQRVAGRAMVLMRLFGVPEHLVKSIGLATCFHDMGYEKPKGKRLCDLTKKDFDNHAERGAEIFEALFDEPRFCGYFSDWDDDMKRQALLAIRYHNGACSDEYDTHRSRIPKGPKIVRASDHIDNVKERIRWDCVNPNILSADKHLPHRLVPGSIRDVDVVVDRVRRHIEIVHHVSGYEVQQHCGRNYPMQDLRKGFRNAFGDKIRGVKGVFEDALEFPATDAEALTFDIVWRQDGNREDRDPI